MTDIASGLIVLIAALTIIVAGLVLYLIMLLARIETVLWRVTKYLPPETPRDWNGRRLYERQ